MDGVTRFDELKRSWAITIKDMRIYFLRPGTDRRVQRQVRFWGALPRQPGMDKVQEGTIPRDNGAVSS
jgi:hypothetical protein